MASRLERGLKILLLLQKGVPYDAIGLSKAMGVSRRTIFRDMALLKEMGLPIAYDTASACYSYDIKRDGHQVEMEADQIRDLLVSAMVAARNGEPLDQEELRSRVVAFATRLPKPMRAKVEASLQPETDTARSEDCRMRWVVAQIAQAIGQQSLIKLEPAGGENQSSGPPSGVLVVQPRELRCTVAGWSLIGVIVPAEGANVLTRSGRQEFAMCDYTVATGDD